MSGEPFLATGLFVHSAHAVYPRFAGLHAFNVATLFGWASVAMTYFGVNYYLSGLHSYAAGDPVPVPDFVWWIVGGLVAISILAKWREWVNAK